MVMIPEVVKTKDKVRNLLPVLLRMKKYKKKKKKTGPEFFKF